MAKLGDVINEFINYVQYQTITIDDYDNSVSYTLTFKKDVIQDIVGFDFTNILNAYSNSISIRFYSDETDFFEAIIKSGYDTDEFISNMRDLEDFVVIKAEINVNKKLLIASLTSQIDGYNIHILLNEDKLIKFLSKKQLADIDNEWFKKEKRLLVILIDGDVYLENERTLIVSNIDIDNANSYSRTDEFENAAKKISFRNQICNCTFATSYFIPEDIYFNLGNKNHCCEKLENVIVDRLIKMIIPSISDFSEDNNGKIHSIFSGNKKIDIEYDVDKTLKFSDIQGLYNIYNWIYSGELNVDKFSICRNIISISLCEICNRSYYEVLIEDAQKIYDSVIKNYDKYLIKNVETYFKEKYKAKDTIFSEIEKMNNNINAMIENMNKNLFTLVGAFLVAVVTYVAKENILILKLTAIIYGVYLLLNCVYFMPYYFHKKGLINSEHTENMKMFRRSLLEKDVPDDSNFSHSYKLCNIYFWCSLFLMVLLLGIDIVFVFKTSNFIDVAKEVMNSI